MKNRLQKLWNQAIPGSGPCPRPDVKKVRRRVDAALDANRRTFHFRRTVKLAALCAAALVLLTGAAAVAVEAALPEYNVLSAFFRGDPSPWEGMVNAQPVSVSDDNYTLTLTSSVADRSTLFYTLTLEAKSDEAWERLKEEQDKSWGDLWSFPFSGGLSLDGEEEPEARTMYLKLNTDRNWLNYASVRFNLMDEGIWLNFTYSPVSDLELNINADGLGKDRSWRSDAQGTVTLQKLRLSPLTIQAEFITEDTDLFPVLYFLWEDGTYSDVESMLGSSGHGSGHGVDGVVRFTMSRDFLSVQDLSQIKAVVFEGAAYPLDHGESYPVDLNALTLRETES